jgi:hypothetical protein
MSQKYIATLVSLGGLQIPVADVVGYHFGRDAWHLTTDHGFVMVNTANTLAVQCERLPDPVDTPELRIVSAERWRRGPAGDRVNSMPAGISRQGGAAAFSPHS